MIDCAIRLDVRDSQPLARAFTLARGDENAVRLLLRFFDGEEELGQQTGDYATLSLRKFGEETSTDYLLTRTDGAYALTAASETPFSFNVSPYTQEELASKAHNYELEKCGETVLCVDYKMSGVGSNSCGPLLMPQYQLNEETFDFAFTLTVE